MSFKLLDARTVERIRTKPHRPYLVLEYGGPDDGLYVATGRAKCRACGQKIEKGAEAIRFTYDFIGSGTWTAVDASIHVQCAPTEGQRAGAAEGRG
jgi:hypothetical protein